MGRGRRDRYIGNFARPSEFNSPPVFASYVTELAVGLAIFAAGVAFGWYLYRAARRANPPFIIRHSGVADVVTVLELGLLAIGFAYLVDGLMRALPG